MPGRTVSFSCTDTSCYLCNPFLEIPVIQPTITRIAAPSFTSDISFNYSGNPWVVDPVPPRRRRSQRPVVEVIETAVSDDMSQMEESEALMSEPDHGRGTCDCNGCRLKKKLPVTGIRSTSIQEYHATPSGGWRPHAVLGDPFKYMMGVELETDNTNSSYYDSEHVPNEWAAGMKKPRNFWLAKHDGSVSGPEFASHPATLTWWQEHRDDIEDMFRMLVHAGFRSHDGGNAGMHVNVSRSAFSSAAHVHRFINLIHAKPNWSLIMSQRTKYQADQWARLDRFSSRQYSYNADYNMKETAQRAFDGNYATDKYSAFNAPEGQQRFEFRLPRGTLRPDRFFKNLEWTQAMVEFTRTLRSIRSSVPAKFMDYVTANASAYSTLDAYQAERSDILNTAAE